jgi:tetratricopeptide (TPR) repeat protein
MSRWALAAIAWLLFSGTGTASDYRQSCLAIPPGVETLTPGFRAKLQAARQRLSTQLGEDPPAPQQAQAGEFGFLGQLYHSHLLFAPAQACYQATLELRPDDYRAHYYLGYLHQQQSHLDPAAAEFSLALKAKSDLAQAVLRLAAIRIEQGRDQEAVTLLEPWRDTPNLAAWVSYQLGRRALAAGRYQQALEQLQRALSLTPTATRIHYPLAMAWRGLGDRRRARHHLAQRGDREPSFPDPLVTHLEGLIQERQPEFHRAMTAARQHDYPQAIAAFRQGLAADPGNQYARISLARSLYLNGEPEAAQAQLQQVIEQRPQPLASFLLGILDDHPGGAPDAEARYQQTLALDPNHSGAHFYLANRLLARRDFSTAADHYRAAHEPLPDHRAARLREVLAGAYGGASEAATLTALEGLHRAYPSDPAIGYYLSRLLTLAAQTSLRDPERADKLATTLYGEYPGPNQAELVALVAAARGQFPRAEQWMDQAIKDAQQMHPPAAPAILEQLRRLREHYRHGLATTETPLGDPLMPPPPDIPRVFRSYPSGKAY